MYEAEQVILLMVVKEISAMTSQEEESETYKNGLFCLNTMEKLIILELHGICNNFPHICNSSLRMASFYKLMCELISET